LLRRGICNPVSVEGKRLTHPKYGGCTRLSNTLAAVLGNPVKPESKGSRDMPVGSNALGVSKRERNGEIVSGNCFPKRNSGEKMKGVKN